MKKRILSMLLALMMVVGMLPISTLTANAAELGTITNLHRGVLTDGEYPSYVYWDAVEGASEYVITTTIDGKTYSENFDGTNWNYNGTEQLSTPWVPSEAAPVKNKTVTVQVTAGYNYGNIFVEVATGTITFPVEYQTSNFKVPAILIGSDYYELVSDGNMKLETLWKNGKIGDAFVEVLQEPDVSSWDTVSGYPKFQIDEAPDWVQLWSNYQDDGWCYKDVTISFEPPAGYAGDDKVYISVKTAETDGFVMVIGVDTKPGMAYEGTEYEYFLQELKLELSPELVSYWDIWGGTIKPSLNVFLGYIQDATVIQGYYGTVSTNARRLLSEIWASAPNVDSWKMFTIDLENSKGTILSGNSVITAGAYRYKFNINQSDWDEWVNGNKHLKFADDLTVYVNGELAQCTTNANGNISAYSPWIYIYDEKPEINSVTVNGESVADGATYVSNSKSVTVKTTYDSVLSQALQDYGCTVKYKTSLNGVDYSNVTTSTSNGNGTSTQTYVQNVNSGSSLTFKSWLEVTWPNGSKDVVDERTTNVTYDGVKNVSVSATFSGTPANATSNTDGVKVTNTKWYKWVESGSTAGYVEMGASDTIKEGALYKCEVTVAEDGDKLASGYTVKINGHEAEKKYGTNHTWVYETRLEGTTRYVDVDDIDLPEAYTNPDFTYNDEEGAAYHWDVVQVEWFECDKDGHKLSDALPADHIFEKGGYYRVEVTVEPETNWQFHGSDLGFYINGKAVQYLYYYNNDYSNSVTGYAVYNTADIEGNYELFVYDDSLSGSAKNIYIKDGQYLGSDATAPSDTKPASGGYAYYKDGVLELNGYNNEKAHFYFEELALELWLIGDNTIGAIYDNEFGLNDLEKRQGNLVINANPGGKLVIASNPLDAYANIQVKDLYFKGGDVTSCLANGTYGAAVQLNDGKLYLEKGTAAYVSDSSDFSTATKWDGTTNIGTYDNVWLKTIGTYQVVFIDDDNTVLDMVRVTDGDTVPQPEDPVKTGYKFLGWYTDGGDKFDFSTPITEDIYLTARYEQLTVISEVNITVTAPAVGATPSTTCTVETAGVTASISWNEVVTAGEQYSGSVTTFEAGKQYATFVFVEAKDGYYLTDDVVIKVNGKAAFLYAGINIVEFDALPGGNSGGNVLKGDVNLDGVVDMKDAAALQRHVLKMTEITDANALAVAELTGDGIIDMKDAAKLTQYAIKMIDSLD